MAELLPLQVSTRKMATIAATAGQVVLPFTFPVQRAEDLAVYRTRATVLTQLALDVDYKVYGAGLASTGGWAELLVGATAGDTYDLEGLGVLSREQTVAQAGKYRSTLVDAELNRLMLLHQEVRRDIGVLLNAANLTAAIAQIGNSVANAAASAAAAAATYDSFDDRYLGVKAADPTTDNDGNALANGMLYYNSTGNVLRIRKAGAWADVVTYGNFTGDAGAGGAAGLVPAPTAGLAALGYLLGAGGAWINELPGRWSRPLNGTLQSVTNSTVLVNSNLKVTLTAQQRIIMRGHLFFTTGSGFGGIKVAVTGPAAPDRVRIKIGAKTGTSYTTIVNEPIAALDPLAHYDFAIDVDNGANAGDVVIQFAQNNANAVAATLEPSSYLEYRTLP